MEKKGVGFMVQIQKSFQNDGAKLYVVPTPIGNLDDMTIRAVNILKEVDVIACEDTRQTSKLINHFNIEASLISYHEHNKFERENQLLDLLKQGKSIALVSDAGMPIISDPGAELVRRVREEGFDVIVLPGANAALTALVGSGLAGGSFTFYGFLPRKKSEIIQVLKALSEQEHTLIFYESPHRVKKTLQTMQEVYASDRKVVLARELTKKFEEYITGTIDELMVLIESEQLELRGEFVIVVEGRKEFENSLSTWWEQLSINEHIEHYIREENITSKEAIKRVANERKLPKREVYQKYHQNEN